MYGQEATLLCGNPILSPKTILRIIDKNKLLTINVTAVGSLARAESVFFVILDVSFLVSLDRFCGQGDTW